MATPASPNLSTLPLDLLTDNLLPLLPASDLVHLASTSHEFHQTVNGPDGEAVWRAKAANEFNFPVLGSARRSGWKELYRQLSRASAYVWGENGNGRLGLASTDHSQATRRLLIAGGLPLPTRLTLPAPPVSLTATGFGMGALTTAGQLIVWGTLDGSIWGPRAAPLSHPGREVTPRLVPRKVADGLGEVKQVEGGRKHLVIRNSKGEVWEIRSWGRAGKIVDEEGRWGVASGEGGEVVAVDAGWEHSTVLTKDGSGYVMYEPGSQRVQQLAEEAGEAGSAKDGVAFEILTHTVKLPSLPSALSRHPVGTEHEKLVLLASGQGFVLGLSSTHSVYHLDINPIPDPARPAQPAGAVGDLEDSPTVSRASRERLAAAFTSGQRKWTRLDQFSDLAGEALLPVWDLAGMPRPAAETRVTHISAHFNSFAVYSVPPTDDPEGSYVLLGTNPTDPPTILPELQNQGVIKVAQGDYHTLALTSSGSLHSWGAYSNGALGLGHPQSYDGALSAMDRPHSPPSTILPYRQIQSPPERVEKPTRVTFRGEKDGGAGKFVFAVAASGWHSGCLAVDRASEDVSAQHQEAEADPTIYTPGSDDEDDREREPPIPHHDNTPPPGWAAADGGRAGTGPAVMGPVGTGLVGARIPRFRVGYAGRGRVPPGRGGMMGLNRPRQAEE